MNTHIEPNKNAAIEQYNEMDDLIKTSFAKIAPFWPLENLIAVNPLQGFEDLPIEEALKLGACYFEQPDLPEEMLSINIETIKWLSTYLDEGQATIIMPLKKGGFFNALRHLVPLDEKIHRNEKDKVKFLKNLPNTPAQVISNCLAKLDIGVSEQQEFITLLLTTLPGWASFIKYKTEWETVGSKTNSISQLDYIAVRILITTLLWPQAKKIIDFHKKATEKKQNNRLENIEKFEKSFRGPLLKKIADQTANKSRAPESQFVFCIDVRSEPFRKSLESTGDYETFGFAGFFGVPVQITEKITGASYASCPVLLKPKHEIIEAPNTVKEYATCQNKYEKNQLLKKLYQSTKYNFATPFALVETLGGLAGMWMCMRTLFPRLTSNIRKTFGTKVDNHSLLESSIDGISLQDKCIYAKSALKMMGLIDNFSPLIVFCGHGSSTQNNAYATSLDCGACGGRHGANNAKILASIMNCPKVRAELAINGINIPQTSRFIAAEHNTTTDEVLLFCKDETKDIQKIKNDLKKARLINNAFRINKLSGFAVNPDKISMRSEDWAQVRPEWGLARNAAFIIAPRERTSSLDLDGRCFLHSYDYKIDPDGEFLSTILTAPVIVAEWINMQYLFSTLNNVAYGGGSKITKNIVGKIGIMQGNASDLMNGLPLQSIYSCDTKAYHEPQRLMVVVLAKQVILDKIIQKYNILQKLFGNGWIQMTMIDPDDNKIYNLNRDLLWQEVTE